MAYASRLGAKLFGNVVGSSSRKQLSVVSKCAVDRIRFDVESDNIVGNNNTSSVVRFHSSETYVYKPESDFQKGAIAKLIRDSGSVRRAFEKGLNLEDLDTKAVRLVDDWYRVLFTIPENQKDLLERSARSIDYLVRRCLSRRHEANLIFASAVKMTRSGIYAWGRVASFDRKACARAEDLYYELKRAYKEAGDDGSSVQSLADVHEVLAYCCSKADNNPNSAKRAHHWMNMVIDNPDMELKSATLAAVMRAYARKGQFQQVQELANAWPKLKNSHTCAVLMEAALSSKNPEGQQVARQALNEGTQQCLEDGDAQNLSDLYARYMKLNDATPQLCEVALNQLLHLQQEHPSLLLLSNRHFIITMSGFAAKGDATKVEELFRRMERLANDGIGGINLEYQALCVVIQAFAKKNDAQHLQRAEGLLKFVEGFLEVKSSDQKVGNHAYNIILHAYSRSERVLDRRERVESTLQRMDELAEAYSNESLRPDRFSYACLLRVIMEEGAPNMIEEVESIVSGMETSNSSSNHPDARIYTLLLEAYSRRSDDTSIDKAEALWNWLGQKDSNGESSVYPDAVTYRLMLKVYANFAQVSQSDSLLHAMIEDYYAGNHKGKPSEDAFLIGMIAWNRSRRSDSIDGALRLFNVMVTEFKRGNVGCRPTARSLNQLMVVIANNERPGRLEIANRLLGLMAEEYSIEPDRLVLNWYLRLCISIPPEEVDGAIILEKVFDTLECLRNSKGGADSHSFLSAILACEGRLHGDKLRERISALFGQCKQDGMVTRRILAAMKRILPVDDYRKFTSLEPGEYFDERYIPLSWRAATNFLT